MNSLLSWRSPESESDVLSCLLFSTLGMMHSSCVFLKMWSMVSAEDTVPFQGSWEGPQQEGQQPLRREAGGLGTEPAGWSQSARLRFVL